MYDNTTGIQRIKKEFEYIKNEFPLSKLIEGEIALINNDYKHWRICCKGPKKTPYENGIYYFDINLKDNYPSSNPLFTFMTKIYHPNIDLNSGKVCIDYINNWSQYHTLIKSILIIYDLLSNPNFENKLNSNINIEDFEKIAKDYNYKYANRLKYWTKYDFKPINIVINTPKTIHAGESISIQLNEKVFSAKQKYYENCGSYYNNQWLYDGCVLTENEIFDNLDIENLDLIEAHPRSRG